MQRMFLVYISFNLRISLFTHLSSAVNQPRMVHKSLHSTEQFVWHVDHESVWFYKHGCTHNIKLFTETIHGAFGWFYHERREKPARLKECREKACNDRIHAQLHEEQPYLEKEVNDYVLETV